MKKALFYDELDNGEGVVLRDYIDKNTALMYDGQHFDYNYSVMLDSMECPKCHGNENLLFKGDYPDIVSDGYVCVCLDCDEDLYLHEVTKTNQDAR